MPRVGGYCFVSVNGEEVEILEPPEYIFKQAAIGSWVAVTPFGEPDTGFWAKTDSIGYVRQLPEQLSLQVAEQKEIA